VMFSALGVLGLIFSVLLLRADHREGKKLESIDLSSASGS
jgi:hypothetical protein